MGLMKLENGKKAVLYLICGLPGSGKTTLARNEPDEWWDMFEAPGPDENPHRIAG